MEPSTPIAAAVVSGEALLTDDHARATTASLSPVDGQSIPSSAAVPPLADHELVSELVPVLNVPPAWEFALVVASIMLIGGLVGARALELFSGKNLGGSLRSALSGGGDGGDDGDEPEPEDDPRVKDDPVHSYERYISPDTPDELLSDRGLIIRILVENEGQTYQYRIVEETGWSKSKVSRLLSEMNERGEIGKVSVGRENAIVLADQEPDVADDDDRSATVTQSPS